MSLRVFIFVFLGSVSAWGETAVGSRSSQKYKVHGLDVSHHQGEINWEMVKRSKFRFVYIKSTEGGSFKDKLFLKNWNEASSKGLVVGAYHFFTFCKSGTKQFHNFKSIVPLKRGMLIPAIDLEFVGNCKKRPPLAEMMKEIDDFSKGVRNFYGVEPILYVTKDFYETYLKKANHNYKLWVRSLGAEPNFPTINDWIFWQYTNQGRLEGIKGFVDFNVFKGSTSEFEDLRVKIGL